MKTTLIVFHEKYSFFDEEFIELVKYNFTVVNCDISNTIIVSRDITLADLSQIITNNTIFLVNFLDEIALTKIKQCLSNMAQFDFKRFSNGYLGLDENKFVAIINSISTTFHYTDLQKCYTCDNCFWLKLILTDKQKIIDILQPNQNNISLSCYIGNIDSLVCIKSDDTKSLDELKSSIYKQILSYIYADTPNKLNEIVLELLSIRKVQFGYCDNVNKVIWNKYFDKYKSANNSIVQLDFLPDSKTAITLLSQCNLDFIIYIFNDDKFNKISVIDTENTITFKLPLNYNSYQIVDYALLKIVEKLH